MKVKRRLLVSRKPIYGEELFIVLSTGTVVRVVVAPLPGTGVAHVYAVSFSLQLTLGAQDALDVSCLCSLAATHARQFETRFRGKKL